MKTVRSVEQVVNYFKDNQFPLFFLGSLYGTAMMNIYPFIPRYQVITCCDPYFGAFPFVTVPQFIRKGNHQFFFMEINPRLTGSTCLSFELYQAQGHRFPILLYHCLEYLGVKIDLDLDVLNNEWIRLQHYQEEYSHLIVRAFSLSQAHIPFTFPAGIWKFQNGVPTPTGKIDFRLRNLQEDEVLFLPARGIFKAIMGFKGRIQDYNFKLTEKYKGIINQLIAFRLKDKREEE